MSANYLITGTGARVGKTVVGCALGFAFRARGLRVGVMKPVETEFDPRGPERDKTDFRALALASGCALPIELMCPYPFRSAPAAAASGVEPDLDRIRDCFNQIAAASDIVLVESTGGLFAPLNRDADFADLASALALEIIVVIANRPGCVNMVLDTFRQAANRRLNIAGWLLNDVEPLTDPDAAQVAALLSGRTTLPCLGTMRFKEPLGIRSVEELLERRNR